MNGRLGVIEAIFAKDVRLFLRDRFYLFASVLGLVFYVGVFWLLPSTAQERIALGIHLPGGEALLDEAIEDNAEEGLDLTVFPSSAALEAAVAGGSQVAAGLDFPENFLAAARAGEPTTVRVLLTASAPDQLRPTLEGAVRELAFELAGEDLPVTFPDTDELILGVDRAGDTLSVRDQMAPLLIFLVLVVEMFALATLVAAEIAQRTITAVLVTPARVSDVLAAKTVFGTLLAFSQAVLLALLTGTFTRGPGILLLAILLGALLVTSFGLVAGSTGQDFVGIVFWSVVLMLPLAVPAFSVLFPGTPPVWIQALPTYGLVETLLRVTAYGEGWATVWPYVAMSAAWCTVAFGAGIAVLGRRVARA